METKNIIVSLLILFTLVGGITAAVRSTRNQQLRVGLAWDCSKYNFDVSREGEVIVVNGSSNHESSQQANIYIDQVLEKTFDVPELFPGDTAVLGSFGVSSFSGFTWEVVGTKDCTDSGSYAPIASDQPVMYFTPSEKTVPVNSSGHLYDIYLDTAGFQVNGLVYEVNFNPDNIVVTNILEGEILYQVVAHEVSGGTAYLEVKSAEDKPFVGEGVVARVEFETKGNATPPNHPEKFIFGKNSQIHTKTISGGLPSGTPPGYIHITDAVLPTPTPPVCTPECPAPPEPCAWEIDYVNCTCGTLVCDLTPTPTPSVNPTATPTATPTPTNTPTPTATATPVPPDITVTFVPDVETTQVENTVVSSVVLNSIAAEGVSEVSLVLSHTPDYRTPDIAVGNITLDSFFTNSSSWNCSTTIPFTQGSTTYFGANCRLENSTSYLHPNDTLFLTYEIAALGITYTSPVAVKIESASFFRNPLGGYFTADLSATAQYFFCGTDYNNDGISNGNDFSAWAYHFNPFNPVNGGPAVGDFNCDGFVNATDFSLWSFNFQPF